MKYYHNMGCGAAGAYAVPGTYRGMNVPNAGQEASVCRRAGESEFSLAMAYVPWQQWVETYPVETALARGTLFPVLDLPFTGCQRRNCHG